MDEFSLGNCTEMNADKKRIMIIEDDSEMRSLLKDFMEEEGYEVVSASNGSEALQKLSGEIFDLIITDIRMPGLTGLDIIPGIKKLQPQVPIMVITAFGSEEIYQKSRERGAFAYLEKPICFNKLGAIIREMIW
jgi:DNA-binding NtrC family response regulator